MEETKYRLSAKIDYLEEKFGIFAVGNVEIVKLFEEKAGLSNEVEKIYDQISVTKACTGNFWAVVFGYCIRQIGTNVGMPAPTSVDIERMLNICGIHSVHLCYIIDI